MSPPDPELLERMHRHFAVECNNHAWDLAERDQRTAEEDAELLNTAHAAAYHWSRVGTALNGARANQLLSEVYAQAGDGARALALARQCRDFFTDHGEGSEWDRASTTLLLAFAHAVTGDREEGARLLEEASRQGELIPEQGERQFFHETHQRIANHMAAL